MGFLRTIITIILIYYTAKLVLRILLPFFIKYLAKYVGKKFQFDANQQKQQQREGEISIEGDVHPKSKIDSSVAEDVDYEEIK